LNNTQLYNFGNVAQILPISYFNIPYLLDVAAANLYNNKNLTYTNGIIVFILSILVCYFTSLLYFNKKDILYIHDCLKSYWKYASILQEAFEMNPLPVINEKKRGRKKKGKILALITSLLEYKESVCLFVKIFAVPIDNKLEERDIRILHF
jgi:uncharacterized membrane protein YkvI